MSLRVWAPDFGASTSATAAPTAAPVRKNPAIWVFVNLAIKHLRKTSRNQHSTGAHVCQNFETNSKFSVLDDASRRVLCVVFCQTSRQRRHRADRARPWESSSSSCWGYLWLA